MKALNRSGVLVGERDVRVEPRETPAPDAEGVVVEVDACGICGSDLHMWKDIPIPLPSVLGHEFSGRVTAVGDQVRDIRPGDRVTANPMHGNLGTGGLPGAFADYVHVPHAVVGKTIYHLPDELSAEEGALVEPLAVALHAIRRAGLPPQAKVAVLGAGPIGLCTVAALKARGISDIALTDVETLRLSLGRELGAKVCVNVREEDPIDVMRRSFGECPIPYNAPAAQVDVVFECAGVPASFKTAVDVVRFGGTIVYVASGPPVELNPNDLLMRELNLLGSWSYVDEFPEAIALLRSKQVDLGPMVTQRYPLEDLREAFEVQADASRSAKVMIVMRDEEPA